MSRLIASIAMLAVAASLTGCVVAPGYDYAYAQPYYPGYGYAYGPAYGRPTVAVDIWGGWGGSVLLLPRRGLARRQAGMVEVGTAAAAGMAAVGSHGAASGGGSSWSSGGAWEGMGID